MNNNTITGQLSLAAKHEIRNLREFVQARQGSEGFLKQLRFRESKLSKEAEEAWHNWSSEEVTKALDEVQHITMYEDCRLIEQNGRFVMFNSKGAKHDISSDPRITSKERMVAHWRSFLQQLGFKLPVCITNLNREKLVEGIRAAKEAATRDEGNDCFCCAHGQVVPVDESGERIEDLMYFFDGCPSVKELKALFTNPKVCKAYVEGMTMRKADWGNAAERLENAEPCDWWVMEIAGEIRAEKEN